MPLSPAPGARGAACVSFAMDDVPVGRPRIRLRIHKALPRLFVGMLILLAVRGDGVASLAHFVVGFALLLAALLLHEGGHVLVARLLHLQVLDVVVHPFGGMARIAGLSDDPRAEALVAGAGPAANLAVAAISFALAPGATHGGTTIPGAFILINLVLGLGNLVPAFPTDGGRLLRALLVPRLGRARATRVALAAGTACGIALLLAPLLHFIWPLDVLVLVACPATGLVLLALARAERRRDAAVVAAAVPTP